MNEGARFNFTTSEVLDLYSAENASTLTVSNFTVDEEAVYKAPTWVYYSSAVSLFLIGLLGIGSNLITIIIYLTDRSVRAH